ncbi:hypothetical protein N7519_006700 [Penicillium mononematosum]|uniref:uncharacterized protein n=1 Tax=Penicillium mononematosum TaxID=268346 RepID=UPI0025495765|nr:uncharacterized protein N7519_006700 [Penicillium mononematosum]KAJ6185399.1 hypothetical protein N7519_006700 [Penicillium mononematosum]
MPLRPRLPGIDLLPEGLSAKPNGIAQVIPAGLEPKEIPLSAPENSPCYPSGKAPGSTSHDIDVGSSGARIRPARPFEEYTESVRLLSSQVGAEDQSELAQAWVAGLNNQVISAAVRTSMLSWDKVKIPKTVAFVRQALGNQASEYAAPPRTESEKVAAALSDLTEMMKGAPTVYQALSGLSGSIRRVSPKTPSRRITNQFNNALDPCSSTTGG